MKVSEFFDIEKIVLDDMTNVWDESDYWSKAAKFVIDNWNTDVERLTPKQAKWLTQIQEDMAEKRVEGKL